MAVANDMSKQCISANCRLLFDSVWILLAKISVEPFPVSAYVLTSFKVCDVYTQYTPFKTKNLFLMAIQKILDIL